MVLTNPSYYDPTFFVLQTCAFNAKQRRCCVPSHLWRGGVPSHRPEPPPQGDILSAQTQSHHRPDPNPNAVT
jgi:hypothetical protein